MPAYPDPSFYQARTVKISSVRIKDDVSLLVETIARLTIDAGFRPWQIVDLFKYLNHSHWAAYAREAGVTAPSTEVVEATVAAYKAKVGYQGI